MPTVSAVDSEDMRVIRVLVIFNTEPSPLTSISSCVQIDPSPTTVIRTTPALSQQNTPVKEGKEGNSTCHILTCLTEMEAQSSSENVARNEGAILNYVQTRIAIRLVGEELQKACT